MKRRDGLGEPSRKLLPRRLLAQVPELGMKTEKHSRKMYRGQEIIDVTPTAKIAEAGQEDGLPRKKKIIYRGQVVG